MNPNTVLATHVATEILLISGLSFYFHRKCKSQETTIEELKTKLNEQDKKINNLFAQLQVLHKDIKTVSDNVDAQVDNSPSTVRRRRPQQAYNEEAEEEQAAFQMAQMMARQQQAQMQARQQQMQQMQARQQAQQQTQEPVQPPTSPNTPNMQPVSYPPNLQPTEMKQVRVVQMPQSGLGGLPAIGMPMFPVNALFNMMNMDTAPNPNNPPVMVEEEADDEGDVSEELASLNQ